MKLTQFQVQMYRGVIDSGPVVVQPLTALVGKNESGKTTLLKALHKLNPATPEPYDMDREWPRGRRSERNPKQVVCSATFELLDEESAELSAMTDQEGTITTVVVTRDYAGNVEVLFPQGLFPDALHPNQVDGVCASLKAVPDAIGQAFSLAAKECLDEIRRLAREGRFSELEDLAAEQTARLQPCVAPAEAPEHATQQKYLAQHAAAIAKLVEKLKTIPPIQKQAHDYIVQHLPKFIYMADYRMFKGNAILNQVKERRDNGRRGADDDTFLMILKLSQLSLDDLVVAGGAEGREQRQYDLDDGGKTLTRLFKDRLKQREYEVVFRADGQEFYTMVNDDTDVGLIRLEERSKGFQWFFSFDLLFMHESGGTFENCVLLLDEPGLHLHPGAQTDLLARLAAYAKGNTLIYSTHLPFMLDLRHPERIRVISDTSAGTVVTEDLTATDPASRLTLEAALGMSGRQSYLVAQRNIVVEGVDDYMMLCELSDLLVRSGQPGLPEDVLVTAAGGASEVAYIATFMIGQELGVAALLDTDKAGEDARDKLVKSWLTRYKGTESQVVGLGPAVGATATEFSIEDLFSDDFYLARVREVYAKDLAVADGELALGGDGQLCKRVERALAKLGIKFNKGSVAKRIRRDIRKMTAIDEIPEPTRSYAPKLIAALTAALPQPE